MIQYLKNTSLVFLFLFLAIATVNAQTTDTEQEEIMHQPDFAIKFSPLALLSTTPAVQFGVETKTFKLQGLQVELGYITSAISGRKSDFDGFKIKSEYRFYKKQLNRFSNINFIGIQHMYKLVNVEGDATIWRENGSYQQVFPLKVKNNINSLFLVGGFSQKLSKHMYIEVAVGVGPRFLKITSSDLPEDAELDTGLNQGFLNPIRAEGNYRFLDAFVSLKLAYYL